MDFWQFAANYWWLAFPIIGGGAAAIGSMNTAMERRAKRRHKQRLELMQAKADLQAARTLGRSPRAAEAPAPSAPPPRAQLASLTAAHDAVTARWLEYELDVAKLIAFPAMSDGRQPLTAAFLRAKKHADTLRPAADAKVSPDELAEYRAAVTDYEVAFDIAERDARRLRDASFSAEERKRLETAQRLLSVAVDDAATSAERQTAYKRVREELDGLIAVSDEAIEILEDRVALPLERGRDL